LNKMQISGKSNECIVNQYFFNKFKWLSGCLLQVHRTRTMRRDIKRGLQSKL
jgi:hypothetical protein